MAINPVGFTGTVSEVDFAELMSGTVGYGILGAYLDGSFAATRVVGSRTVLVQPGTLMVPGVKVEMDAAASPTASANNATGANRVDLLVMRINWSAHTATLVIITGTTVAPTYNGTPGVLFDVPLAQLTLPSGDSDYSSVNIVSRRVWLRNGVQVAPSAVTFPTTGTRPLAGAMVVQPDLRRVLVRNTASTGWDIYNAESDSGVVELSLPAGWTGAFSVRVINRIAFLKFAWSWPGAAQTTEVPFASLGDYQPDGTWYGSVFSNYSGVQAVRVLLSTSTNRISPVTVQPGLSITGTMTYHL